MVYLNTTIWMCCLGTQWNLLKKMKILRMKYKIVNGCSKCGGKLYGLEIEPQ